LPATAATNVRGSTNKVKLLVSISWLVTACCVIGYKCAILEDSSCSRCSWNFNASVLRWTVCWKKGRC
jgi:hypothetical protein